MARRVRGIGVDGRFLTREQETNGAPRIGAARMVLTTASVSARVGVGGRRGRRRRRARERTRAEDLRLWWVEAKRGLLTAGERMEARRILRVSTPGGTVDGFAETMRRLDPRIRAAVDARASEIAALE